MGAQIDPPGQNHLKKAFIVLKSEKSNFRISPKNKIQLHELTKYDMSIQRLLLTKVG